MADRGLSVPQLTSMATAVRTFTEHERSCVRRSREPHDFCTCGLASALRHNEAAVRELVRRLNEAERERDALRADRDRLDWLGQRITGDNPNGSRIWDMLGLPNRATFTDAIDEARHDDT